MVANIELTLTVVRDLEFLVSSARVPEHVVAGSQFTRVLVTTLSSDLGVVSW